MAKNRRLSRKSHETAVFPVVGIGASAGGLEALTALLKALPANTGMAFVLVQHMDPTHESLLYQLLSKATTMPVAQIADLTRLEPNRVYVIPPVALQVRKTKSILDEMIEIQEQIMRRAFDIFQGNGHLVGQDLRPMCRFFDDWLQAERELVWKPPIEIREKQDEFLIQVAIPGLNPKDLKIEVTPDTILVAADIEYVHHEEKEQIHTCESGAGKLFRAIHLPRRIDPETVKAEFTNGMLKLKATVADKTRAKKGQCGCFVKSSIEICLN